MYAGKNAAFWQEVQTPGHGIVPSHLEERFYGPTGPVLPLTESRAWASWLPLLYELVHDLSQFHTKRHDALFPSLPVQRHKQVFLVNVGNQHMKGFADPASRIQQEQHKQVQLLLVEGVGLRLNQLLYLCRSKRWQDVLRLSQHPKVGMRATCTALLVAARIPMQVGVGPAYDGVHRGFLQSSLAQLYNHSLQLGLCGVF